MNMDKKEESESQGSEEICVLCKHSLVEFETITVCTPKGMKSLIELSNLRNDGLSQYFKGEKLTVHNKCRKKYTRYRNDHMPVDFEDKAEWIVKVGTKTKSKEKMKKPMDDGYQCWYTRVLNALDSASGNDEPFDFKHTCFICGIIFNKKQFTNRKYTVRRDSKEKVMKAVTADNEDPVNKAVLHRIEYVDLVAVEAGYHKICYVYLAVQIRKPTREEGDHVIRTGKRFYKINSGMQIIYDYIEKSGDIQFSIPQLRDLVANANHELADRTILKYLQEKYRERIVVVNVPGTGNVITFIEEDMLN